MSKTIDSPQHSGNDPLTEPFANHRDSNDSQQQVSFMTRSLGGGVHENGSNVKKNSNDSSIHSMAWDEIKVCSCMNKICACQSSRARPDPRQDRLARCSRAARTHVLKGAYHSSRSASTNVFPQSSSYPPCSLTSLKISHSRLTSARIAIWYLQPIPVSSVRSINLSKLLNWWLKTTRKLSSNVLHCVNSHNEVFSN